MVVMAGPGRGFAMGAAVGLVLALFVVGAASLVPGRTAQNSTLETITMAAAAQSSSTPPSPQAPCSAQTPCGPTVATPSGQAGVAASGTQGGGVAPVVTTTTVLGSAAQPAWDLATLPGESLTGVLSVAAPILVGLLLAGLAYGVFVRRQESGT